MTMSRTPRVLYLDQNAWVALAKGAWDKRKFPHEHAALVNVIAAVLEHGAIVPLSFTNIYETIKVNDAARRVHLARTQAILSGGRVFRGRRRIFADTLAGFLASRFGLPRPDLPEHWFLSDLWFESASDYSPDLYGFEISDSALSFIRDNASNVLFDYLTSSDEEVRRKGVRRYSASSAELIARIERRRALVAGQTLALRRRAYGAQLILDELEFILTTGRQLGLHWHDVRDIGSSLLRSLPAEVPVLNVERELAIRLEDQARDVTENDLRDMVAFVTVLTFADVIVAEKPFVNLACQARLGQHYATRMLTSVLDFTPAALLA